MKLFIIITVATFAIAANADCISNGSNPTENGSWCSNMNSQPYCSNYSGCEWLNDAPPLPAAGHCYSNGSNATENGPWCANMNSEPYCSNYSGCEWLEGTN
jgi:hypothetical protein